MQGANGESVDSQSFLIHNGSIYTMNPTQPWAQAVVIRGNKIAYVGTERGARALVDDQTENIDLAGGMCLPGFIDNHLHYLTGPLTKVGFMLAGVKGKEAIQQVIRDWMEANPDSPTVRGSGWLPASFDDVSPKREWLDEVTGDKPALVFSADIHDAWFNTALARQIGLDTPDAPDPLPGKSYYWRDAHGVPEGRASEGPALLPLAVGIGAFTDEGIMDSINLGIMNAPKLGLTSYLDASVNVGASPKDAAKAYELLIALDREGKLPIRVTGTYTSFSPEDDHADSVATLVDWNQRFRSPHVQVSVLKILADGVMQSGGGLLLEPFTHDHSSCGQMTWTHEAMVDLIERVQIAGLDMHIHTDADGTVRAVLDALEATHGVGVSGRRHQVAHCSMVHPDDLGRFVDLAAIANVTPIWGTDYHEQYIDIYHSLIGAERVNERLFPYGDLVRAGATVTIGSDMPAVELSEIGPLIQIEAAVTRRQPGWPDAKPLVERQRMALHDALAAYTINGAYATRREHQIGSIEVGKEADLVMLADDLFRVDPSQIHSVAVRMTMMDGHITHQSD